jgi:hypothetical protein
LGENPILNETIDIKQFLAAIKMKLNQQGAL